MTGKNNKTRVPKYEYYWVPCIRTVGAFRIKEKDDDIDDRLFKEGLYCHSEHEALELSRKLYYEHRLRK